MYSLSWNDGDKSFKAVYPIPISNEDIIFWMLDGILFKKKTGSGPKLSEKADSKSLEKADSKPKFTARVKNFCLRALISNLTIGFSNFSPKKTQIWHSCYKFWHFFYSEILHLDKFESTSFNYNNISFKLKPENTQIKHFWSQTSGFLFLPIILQ